MKKNKPFKNVIRAW